MWFKRGIRVNIGGLVQITHEGRERCTYLGLLKGHKPMKPEPGVLPSFPRSGHAVYIRANESWIRWARIVPMILEDKKLVHCCLSNVFYVSHFPSKYFPQVSGSGQENAVSEPLNKRVIWEDQPLKCLVMPENCPLFLTTESVCSKRGKHELTNFG